MRFHGLPSQDCAHGSQRLHARRSAARALQILVASIALHCCVAALDAPGEKVTVQTLAAMIGLNALLCTVLLRLSLSLKHGRAIQATLAVLSIYGLMMLTAVGLLVGGGYRYTGSMAIIAAQVVLVLSYLYALREAWRLSTPTGRASNRGRPDV